MGKYPHRVEPERRGFFYRIYESLRIHGTVSKAKQKVLKQCKLKITKLLYFEKYRRIQQIFVYLYLDYLYFNKIGAIKYRS